MTIQGAISELVNLLNADDVPIYYKGGIKKVIETIDDYIDGKDDYVKRLPSAQPERCEDCGNFNKTMLLIPQPEIIRCKDCKWWDKSEDSPFGYCMAMKHGYMSTNWEIGIYRRYKGDFYCADAERETDE